MGRVDASVVRDRAENRREERERETGRREGEGRNIEYIEQHEKEVQIRWRKRFLFVAIVNKKIEMCFAFFSRNPNILNSKREKKNTKPVGFDRP